MSGFVSSTSYDSQDERRLVLPWPFGKMGSSLRVYRAFVCDGRVRVFYGILLEPSSIEWSLSVYICVSEFPNSSKPTKILALCGWILITVKLRNVSSLKAQLNFNCDALKFYRVVLTPCM